MAFLSLVDGSVVAHPFRHTVELVGLMREISSVPVIASGGAGKAADFAPAIRAGADAVLAASVFHSGQLSVGDVKDALVADGIDVRTVTA